MLLGGMIGLGPEVALALSLVKRVRELVIGVPGLFAWQIAEGKNFLSGIRRRRGDAPPSPEPPAPAASAASRSREAL